jgi:acetolactate synthase-1/2/3 large subunit
MEWMASLGAVAVTASQSLAQDPPLPEPMLPRAVPQPPIDARGGVHGRMTGAQAAAAALACEGVPCVFGVPGAQNNEFWDAMKVQGVPYLLVTNESSASVMADASARATGRVGVFALIPGPGITNALTGIGEALHDSVPIVGIVTDIDRSPGAPVGQVHGLANAAILRPVCKAVFEVQHVNQIPGAIFQAYRVAECGEPGPTAVVIPFRLFIEMGEFACHPYPPIAQPFDEAAYRKALCLLSNRGHRVGIYAGMGTYGATHELAAVAELLQAPVATSVSGKGAISDAHPLAVGWGYGPYGTRTAERAFKDVDLVLAVGVRFSEVSTANYSVPEHPHLIHVDANPQILGRNVPTSVGVCADSGIFLSRLISDAHAIRRPTWPELHRNIAKDRAAERAQYWHVEIKHDVDPMYFFVNLRHALHCNDLIFVDVTASVHWASESIEVPGPRHYFTPADNQSMGWAVPAAVGAQRVCLDRRVAAVVGDGCFLMSGLEASTAARSVLPVKFFVFDDGAYHYMQMLQRPTFGRTTATEIARLDYRALAQALGLAYNHIASNDDVACGIARALHTCGPVLTQVDIGYNGRKLRWLEALKSSYIDNLNTRQKARFASRSIVRHANPLLADD